jgi:iron complex outermembrane receptor protein
MGRLICCGASGQLARLLLFSTFNTLVPVGAFAQAASPAEGSDIIVTGYGDRQMLLDVTAKAGSRLGLDVRETPASIDVVTQDQMLERGLRTSVEALNAAPGVVAANLPSIPGTTSMRGFTGDAISQLYDGMAQPFMREFDSWSFDRIEVLKGPASILYGAGALAGAVNFVPKRAELGRTAFSGLGSYGRYDTARIAADANVPLGDAVAIRAIGSLNRSSGYVDDTDSRTEAATLSLTFRPADRVMLEIAGDYTHDRYTTAYWGTPLVPASVARDPSDLVRSSAANANGFVIDRALRSTNINVNDGLESSRTAWLRSRIAWEMADGLRFTNELSYYDAKRRWRNSENGAFNTATGLFDRATTRIDHDNDVLTERAFLTSDAVLGGHRNRATLGMEYSRTNFTNPRSFGTTTSIDLYAPARGHFPDLANPANFPGAGNRTIFDTDIEVTSVFGEDAFNLTSRWLLVGGFRYDHIDLGRSVTDLNLNSVSTFGRTYSPISWRVGTVYDLLPKTQLYAQYNRSVAPVGSLALISLASSQFALTKGRSAEAGIKSSFWGDRIDLTLAGYWIEQTDIITRDPNNSALSVQGGSQSSRGLEVAVSAALTRELRLDANYSRVKARFDTLVEAGGANRAGNRPPFVSSDVANLFAVYRPQALPVTLSAGVRHAGAFYADNANAIRVRGYTVADASVSYRLRIGEVTLRVRNLFNEFYATWRGGSVTQLMLASPRTADASFTVRF